MCGGLSIESNIWEVIPDHIIQVILSKLPIVKLPACRLVCKAWNHLVSDYASHSKFVPNTYFVFKLYNESKPYWGVHSVKSMQSDYHKMHCIDFDAKYSQGMNDIAAFRFNPTCLDIKISNSCNGLLCVINGMHYARTYASILNPMTNEYIKLPGYEDSKNFYRTYFYGFGFSLKTMHYKVARVSFLKYKYGCITEIFTLGKSTKWSYGVPFLPFTIENDGVYFNGGLYWIGVDEKNKCVLCCLDVEDENFEIIFLPKVASSITIGVFNGSLYTTFWVEKQYRKLEVWMMQSYGGAKDSLRKEFVIDDIPNDYWVLQQLRISCRYHLQLIKAYENGEILCLLDEFYLFLYNPKTGKIKTLIQDKPGERTFWIYPIESLNFDSLKKIFVKGG